MSWGGTHSNMSTFTYTFVQSSLLTPACISLVCMRIHRNIGELYNLASTIGITVEGEVSKRPVEISLWRQDVHTSHLAKLLG